jgi:hypothetical protein
LIFKTIFQSEKLFGVTVKIWAYPLFKYFHWILSICDIPYLKVFPLTLLILTLKLSEFSSFYLLHNKKKCNVVFQFTVAYLLIIIILEYIETSINQILLICFTYILNCESWHKSVFSDVKIIKLFECIRCVMWFVHIQLRWCKLNR